MPSTYSDYKIELIATGEQQGVWGETTNANLQAIEQALGGYAAVTVDSTLVTLTLSDTNASQDARALFLDLSGAPGNNAVLEVPAIEKAYIVKNSVSGGYGVTVKVVSRPDGVLVPNGFAALVYVNGTDAIPAISSANNFSVTGNTTLGDETGDIVTFKASNVATPNGLKVDTTTLVVDAANNRVGMGLAAPMCTLDVSGSVNNVNTLGTLDASTIRVTNLDNTLGNRATISFDLLTLGKSTISGIYLTNPSFLSIGTGIVFGTQNNLIQGTLERARIDNNGTFTVWSPGPVPLGTPSDPIGGRFNGCAIGPAVPDYSGMNLRAKSASVKFGIDSLAGYSLVFFTDNGSNYAIAGNIYSNGASTSYNTSCDYRMKKNITEITDGLATIALLTPKTWHWKTEFKGAHETGLGFIAHELQAVIPQAVVGEKDAVDNEGTPIYQSVDLSSVIPVLTAAIKELNAQVVALTARVTALETP